VTAQTQAAPKGLSSVPQVSVILEPQAPPAPKFPGTDLVDSAAAMFYKQPTWDGCEGRAFLLTVSPGTVGVTVRDRATLERNSLNALGHDTRGTRAVYAPPADEYDGVRYANEDGPAEFREPRPGRQVEGWSRRSRARMVRRLAQLDWTPLYADGRPAVMLTLTYPGEWLSVAPSGREVKRHLRAFWKRWERRWGAPFVGPWKLEFQRRGAPHVHMLTVPPRDPAFRDWLSAAWVAVVDHQDAEERRRHLLAGTGIDHLKGGRCFDPKRAAVYFSKHGGAAGGKEYQHSVPAEWQQDGAGPGRFWGYKGLEPATATVEVSVADYVQLRRTLRRWSKQAGMKRRVTVERVSPQGVVSYKTRYRRGALSYGGMQGGTVLLNDGPAFASALARLVEGRS
jgi:hypothetical protein